TQHDAGSAIEACTRAAELAPQSGGVYMHRGLAHYYLGDTAAALRDLDRAAELSPRDATVFTNRYLVRSHAGQDALAREDLARACELGHEVACSELRARCRASRAGGDEARADAERERPRAEVRLERALHLPEQGLAPLLEAGDPAPLGQRHHADHRIGEDLGGRGEGDLELLDAHRDVREAGRGHRRLQRR